MAKTHTKSSVFDDDEHTLIEQAMVKLMVERGRVIRTSEFTREAILEFAKKHTNGNTPPTQDNKQDDKQEPAIEPATDPLIDSKQTNPYQSILDVLK